MALDSTKKKRTNLLGIVDRLVEKTEAKNDAILRKKQEEVLLPSPRSAVSIKPYLLPPTPSSGPASPSISDQESVSEEEQVSDKGAIVDDEREEIKKDVGVPKQPLRCGVCGLRVYKSYRYINRTSAPAHLKNFITPENDRIRVCKRCFSSRERCRQNLSLVLLRSKTSQMIHLRTPLGVTYGRATKALDYIARDLKKGFKRPYEDLLCDETMVDEDEMEVDDERFLLNGETTKNQDTMPKLFAMESENTKQGVVLPTPVPIKNIGIVTVVRHHGGKYNSKPNCFTIYGEVDSLKINDSAAAAKAGEQKENSPAINATENLKKLVDQNTPLPPSVRITASAEISTINNKLTFLDHAYALPPPKGKVPSVPKAQAVTKIKSPVNRTIKVTNTSKEEPQKKTASPDGQTTSERTCGIVCFLCDHLVTKSYSCYKKDNAPLKIKHLFTPGVKIVKICRRCMPYKKPKDEISVAGTGKGKIKVIKGKLAKIKSAKLIKNAKSAGKANAVKTGDKKVASVKSLMKDEKKQKDGSKEDKAKVLPAKKQFTVVVQTKKMATSKVTKDINLSNSKTMQVTAKIVFPPKEETMSESGKSVNSKGANTSAKVSLTLPKSVNKGVNAGVVSGKSVNFKGANMSAKVSLTLPKSVNKGVNAGVESGKSVNSKGANTSAKISSTLPNSVNKGVFAGAESGKSVNSKGANTCAKVSSTSPKSVDTGVNAGVAEKSKNNSVETENSATNNLKSGKVDFGTQSMKSLIGISMVKTKSVDSVPSNEGTVKENKPALLNLNEEVEDKPKVEAVDAKSVTAMQVNVTENIASTTSSDEVSLAVKVTTNDVKSNEDNEEKSTGKSTSTASVEENKMDVEENKMDVEQKEGEVVQPKETENVKNESKNTEEKSKEEEKVETITDNKNATGSLNTRQRRSVSKSPVRAREVKPTEVSSPRRGRSSGTPDKKCEDYKQIVPTVMTRKRLASFSESEEEKKSENDTAAGMPAGKRRAVVALLEKMSRKSGESTSAQNFSATKVKVESADAEAPEEEEKGHCMTRRNQVPIKCPGCNEKVVKSYRCFMRITAPSHIKPLFMPEINAGEMLRVCRKCVNRKAKP